MSRVVVIVRRKGQVWRRESCRGFQALPNRQYSAALPHVLVACAPLRCPGQAAHGGGGAAGRSRRCGGRRRGPPPPHPPAGPSACRPGRAWPRAPAQGHPEEGRALGGRADSGRRADSLVGQEHWAGAVPLRCSAAAQPSRCSARLQAVVVADEEGHAVSIVLEALGGRRHVQLHAYNLGDRPGRILDGRHCSANMAKKSGEAGRVRDGMRAALSTCEAEPTSSPSCIKRLPSRTGQQVPEGLPALPVCGTATQSGVWRDRQRDGLAGGKCARPAIQHSPAP